MRQYEHRRAADLVRGMTCIVHVGIDASIPYQTYRRGIAGCARRSGWARRAQQQDGTANMHARARLILARRRRMVS